MKDAVSSEQWWVTVGVGEDDRPGGVTGQADGHHLHVKVGQG